MRYQLAIASLYAQLAKQHAKHAIIVTKDKAVENKSELACLAITSAVVGVAARTTGFRAGYEFANNES